MRIVHISTDNIFLKNAFEQFEACYPGCNELIIWNDEQELKHNAQLSPQKVFRFDTDAETILKELTGSDLVVIHALIVQSANIILKCYDLSIKFCWMLHGFEAYNTDKFDQDSFYTATTLHIMGGFGIKESLKKSARSIAELFVNTDNKVIAKAAQKVDLFGISYKEEYELMKDKFSMKAAFLPFCYYPIETDSSVSFKEQDELNILLGNSATPSNNHIDILQFLSKLENQSFKVNVPLSYGDKTYASEIVTHGTKLLGERFQGINNFMPQEAYNEMLAGCGVCIMNHKRQQAVGTVYSMISFGAKVFLSEKNTLYHYLKRIGIHVFSIENDLQDESSLSLLSDAEIEHNKTKIGSLLNRDHLVSELKKSLDQFLKC